MDIKLSWTNPNSSAVTIKIYRSTAMIDRANLGVPIVTLTNGETSWTDTTAVVGQTYYYVYEINSASDRIVSMNIRSDGDVPTGHGPNKLQWGDSKLGYFGNIPGFSFVSSSELIKKFGLNSDGIYRVLADNPTWFKYIRNGKVLFVPDTALADGITWMKLYNAGLVYGYDGVGKGNPALLPATKVNQLKTIQIGGYTYIVRLMTGYDETFANLCPEARITEYTPLSPPYYSNEWDDLVLPQHISIPEAQKLHNTKTAGADSMNLGHVGNGYYQSGGFYYFLSNGAMCQELISSTKVCCRGGASDNTNYANRAVVAARKGSNIADSVVMFGGSVPSVYSNNPTIHCSGWMPVLELVN